jgi:NAD+-dependent protein deacetylase sirtuin 2
LTGLEQNKTIQCHGHIRSGTCINCEKKFAFDFVKTNLAEQKIPACDECKKVVKPDVVLFGEKLNFHFQKSIKDFKKCDLLIIMGTSLVVEP